MAKKQKDKKINNGRHNNTQTNRQCNGQETKRQKDKTTVDTIIHRQTDNIMAKKQKVKKINNGRHNNTQTNRQYNGQETKRQKDKQRSTQ